MSESVEVEAGLEFGPAQFATFAPIAPIIEPFDRERGLKVSRVFDRDPMAPMACYFVGWHRSFVRIAAADPFAVGEDFRIEVAGPRRSLKKWGYSVAEGTDRLRAILEEAKSLSDGDALSPEEEAALIARSHQGLEHVRKIQRERSPARSNE